MTTTDTGTQMLRIEAALDNIETAIRNLELSVQAYQRRPIKTLLDDRRSERATTSIGTLKRIIKGLNNVLPLGPGVPTP